MSKRENQRTLVPTSGVSFEDQVRIVRAYVVLSDNGSVPVHYKEVMRITRLGRTQISGVNSFVVMLGLLENTSRGNYLPTKVAIDLCNCNPGSEDFTLINTSLQQSDLYTYVDRYLKIHGGGMDQELLEYIGDESETKEHSRISSALEWFIRAGLIEDNSEEVD
ncbi:MAG: hypothetical protein ACW99J_17930 [Candidatus Thorarchaeota archaeon]|jgi:hypothetical protein